MTLSVRSGGCAGKSMFKRCYFLFYNHCTFLLSVAALLSGAMAAPRGNQWWTNPCGVQTVQLRHGRSPAENQLRIFIKLIDNPVFKDLKAIYPTVATNYANRNCPRVNPVLQKMNNANLSLATHIFYESMIEMAKLIQKVQKLPVGTAIKFDAVERKRIYKEVEVNLKSVMCEFSDRLPKLEPVEHKTVPSRFIRRNLSGKCLPKQMNLTEAQIVDMDLFKKMKKFFRQSKIILRRKARANNRRPQLRKKNLNTRRLGKKRIANKKRTMKQKKSSAAA
ncbi:unnamed protein product [Diabrotica balteata]|uniref:Uncharacterized protein n=1 Tax=Diabrotica balteata TaxID=107213 RepID=A0A9N9T040_DIABA|nr:unnamed protein product [Diabrotica balteata]